MPEPQKDPDCTATPALEVEVERLPAGSGGLGEASDSGTKATRVGHILGPVLAGVTIDLIDLATLSPLLGFCVGWPLGAYIARQAGAPGPAAIKLGFLSGLYCAVPMTAGIPIGTMIGLAVKLRRALAGQD